MSGSRLMLGDCLEAMRLLDDASVDAVVTDPPYGISFMGKHWDRFDIDRRVGERDVSKLGVRLTGSADSTNRQETSRTASAFANAAGEAGAYDFSLNGNRAFQAWVEEWSSECLRVLKPGGHAVVFGGTRTYHRLASGLEDAGFAIRDQLAWMFGQGFPKSLDVAKAIDDGPAAEPWRGWGTALKPAFEPVALARKPLIGTVAANMLEHGTGALNIEGCRIEFAGAGDEAESKEKNRHGDFGTQHGGNEVYGDYTMLGERDNYDAPGRWPANVILDEEAGLLLDEQTGDLAAGNHPANRTGRGDEKVYGSGWSSGTAGERRPTEIGGASRFFYCAKVSRAERNAGLDDFEERESPTSDYGLKGVNLTRKDLGPNEVRAVRNHHPTVKPIDLMRWLIRLITPAGALVLDPFLGSGSTGCAAALEGRRFIGVEREADYMAIAEARIGFWTEHGDDGLRICAERDAAERKHVAHADAGQGSIFDLLAADGEAA